MNKINTENIMQLEQDVRDNLNFGYCGNSLLEYRENCANRYDAIVKMMHDNAQLVKKSEYLNKVNKIINNCQKDDVENSISKLVDKIDLNNKQEKEINVIEKLLKVDDKDLDVYAKILEFAIHRRLSGIKINNLILDNVFVKNKKDGTTYADIDFIVNKNLKEKED